MNDIFTSPKILGDPLWIAKIDKKYAPMAYKLASKLTDGYNHLFVAAPGKDGQCWLFAEELEDTWDRPTWIAKLKKAGLI